MGKKKSVLRQPVKENVKYIAPKLGKRSAAEGSVVSNKKIKKSSSSSTSTSKSNNKKESTDDSDDSEGWGEIERRANGGESDDSGDSDSDYDDEDSDVEIKMQGNIEHVSEDYTFEFNDMRDEYSAGIRTMLKTVLANPTEAYSLSDLITAQKIVGTVINCEGGDDAFAFATVLPLAKVLELPTIAKIIECLVASLDALLAKKPSAELKQLRASVDKDGTLSTTGLLLHQRFSNLPIELIGPLHRNLEEDLSWAKQRTNVDSDGEDEDNDDDVSANSANNSNSSSSSSSAVGSKKAGGVSFAAKISSTKKSSSSSSSSSNKSHRNFFSELSHVLLLCPVEAQQEFDLSGGKAHSVVGNTSLTFASFEDEVYFQQAAAAALFKPSKHCNTGLTDVVAVLVPAEKIKGCVNGICALLPDV